MSTHVPEFREAVNGKLLPWIACVVTDSEYQNTQGHTGVYSYGRTVCHALSMRSSSFGLCRLCQPSSRAGRHEDVQPFLTRWHAITCRGCLEAIRDSRCQVKAMFADVAVDPKHSDELMAFVNDMASDPLNGFHMTVLADWVEEAMAGNPAQNVPDVKPFKVPGFHRRSLSDRLRSAAEVLSDKKASKWSAKPYRTKIKSAPQDENGTFAVLLRDDVPKTELVLVPSGAPMRDAYERCATWRMNCDGEGEPPTRSFRKHWTTSELERFLPPV